MPPRRVDPSSGLDGASPDRPAPAVVLGLDSITGLQTARLLSARGIPVEGVVRDARHFAGRSRCLSAVMQASPDDLLAVLEGVNRRIQRPFVVIPCSDSWVSTLAHARRSWPPHVRAVVPDPEVVDGLLDKAQFVEFVTSHGIAVPTTRVVRDERSLEAALGSLTFPVVVKPGRKPAHWDTWMGGKVAMAADPAELRSVAERGLQRAESLVVQEWVEGGDDALISFNGYFDRQSQPRAAFVARKLRQWPPGAGTSASGEEIRDDEVADLAIELFQKAGFQGLAYLEVKRAADGTPMVIEPNVGRPTGRSAICEAGGVELVYTAYRDALGMSLPRNEQTYRGVKWVYLRHDVQAAAAAIRKGELTPAGWLRSLQGPKVYAVWSWRDPVPFFADLYRTLRRVLGRRRSTPARRSRRE